MGRVQSLLIINVLLLLASVSNAKHHWGTASELSVNFYTTTCPNMESIIQHVVDSQFLRDPKSAAAVVRLFFHDAFVNGPDGSILIASTPENSAEKDADPNTSLGGDGFETVAKAKAALETECPGVISCADILAIANRDMLVKTGGPFFNVSKGRRDGRVSQSSQTSANLPNYK